jgi:hypothetical protein
MCGPGPCAAAARAYRVKPDSEGASGRRGGRIGAATAFRGDRCGLEQRSRSVGSASSGRDTVEPLNPPCFRDLAGALRVPEDPIAHSELAALTRRFEEVTEKSDREFGIIKPGATSTDISRPTPASIPPRHGPSAAAAPKYCSHVLPDWADSSACGQRGPLPGGPSAALRTASPKLAEAIISADRTGPLSEGDQQRRTVRPALCVMTARLRLLPARAADPFGHQDAGPMGRGGARRSSPLSSPEQVEAEGGTGVPDDLSLASRRDQSGVAKSRGVFRGGGWADA